MGTPSNVIPSRTNASRSHSDCSRAAPGSASTRRWYSATARAAVTWEDPTGRKGLGHGYYSVRTESLETLLEVLPNDVPPHDRDDRPALQGPAPERRVATLARRSGRGRPCASAAGRARSRPRARRGRGCRRAGRGCGRGSWREGPRAARGRAALAATRRSRQRATAVSRPTMPNAAWSYSTFLSSTVWGAWSVAMQSMVPSRSPSTTAWRSASDRSGGFILVEVSYSVSLTAWSVSSRWWGVASAVTRTPARLAPAHRVHGRRRGEVGDVDPAPGQLGEQRRRAPP